MPTRTSTHIAPTVGRQVTQWLAASYRHGCHKASAFCVELQGFWDRFNTGRAFALIIWMAIAAPFFLPVSPPSLEASNRHSASNTATQSANLSTTRVSANPGEIAGSTAQARIPHHYDAELSLIQRHHLSACWGASSMHVAEALSLAAPLREVVVAILDTGIDTDSALLSDCVYDKVSIVNSPDSADVCGHGTHVAGTVAIIAPNCSIFDVKVADNRGNCTSSDVAEGIRRAVGAGATVINLSLEVDASPELEEAVHYAWQRGALLVAAAGMPTPGALTVGQSSSSSSTPDGPSRPSMSPSVYPAAYPEVVAVTGTNEEGELAPVCNRGTWVDVAAPGLKTFSELPGGTHGYMTGTSTAAAHVSGLAALLCGLADDENNNGRVNDEVRLAIEATSRPMGIEGTGNGIVDAAAAVQYILR